MDFNKVEVSSYRLTLIFIYTFLVLSYKLLDFVFCIVQTIYAQLSDSFW